MLDSHPAVAASAVAGTAVINADLNRLSWRDFVVLVPATVVVASLVLLAMLRFRWRMTLAILMPVGLSTGALVSAMLLSGRPFTMATIALPGLCFTLGSPRACTWRAGSSAGCANARRQRRRGDARRLARAVAADCRLEHHDRARLRPARRDSGEPGAGDGALRRRRRAPVGAARASSSCRSASSGSAPRRSARPARRSSPVSAASRTRWPGWPARITRLRPARYRLLLPVAAVCLVAGLADLGRELRLDLPHDDSAGRAPARRLRPLRRRQPAERPAERRHPPPRRRRAGRRALNTALLDATREIEALPEVSKVVGPASVFSEVAPRLAGSDPVARFAADDASVTDAYIFALSAGTPRSPSYVTTACAPSGWWCSSPISTTPGSRG